MSQKFYFLVIYKMNSLKTSIRYFIIAFQNASNSAMPEQRSNLRGERRQRTGDIFREGKQFCSTL